MVWRDCYSVCVTLADWIRDVKTMARGVHTPEIDAAMGREEETKMTKHYDVFNVDGTGGSLGIWEAEDEDGAIAAYLAAARCDDPPDPGLCAVEVEVCRVCGCHIDEMLNGDRICLRCAEDRVCEVMDLPLDPARAAYEDEALKSIVRNSWTGDGWTGDESARDVALQILEQVRDMLDEEAADAAECARSTDEDD